MLIPNDLFKAVVFVGIVTDEGMPTQEFHSRGTGFIVGIPSPMFPGRSYRYLVTAKHNILGAKKAGQGLVIRINTKDGKYQLLRAGHSNWTEHPSDPAVDAVVIPFSVFESIDVKSIGEEMFLTDEKISKENIGPGSEAFIIGLFTKLHGKSKNLPIVRMANIAMMPDERVHSHIIGDMEAYLIEGRSLGGLSGSPVFVTNTVLWELLPTRKVHFLGLIHGHWDVSADGVADIASQDLGSDSSAKTDQINVGIAVVVPAKKILEILLSEPLAELRREGDKLAASGNPQAPGVP